MFWSFSSAQFSAFHFYTILFSRVSCHVSKQAPPYAFFSLQIVDLFLEFSLSALHFRVLIFCRASCVVEISCVS